MKRRRKATGCGGPAVRRSVLQARRQGVCLWGISTRTTFPSGDRLPIHRLIHGPIELPIKLIYKYVTDNSQRLTVMLTASSLERESETRQVENIALAGDSPLACLRVRRSLGACANRWECARASPAGAPVRAGWLHQSSPRRSEAKTAPRNKKGIGP